MKTEYFDIISQISHDGKFAHSLLSHQLVYRVFVYNFADQLFFARSLCREISSNKPTTPPPQSKLGDDQFSLRKKLQVLPPRLGGGHHEQISSNFFQYQSIFHADQMFLDQFFERNPNFEVSRSSEIIWITRCYLKKKNIKFLIVFRKNLFRKLGR